MTNTEKKSESPTIAAAFGAKNRNRLIDAYFADHAPLTRETAWTHVYRLLLWIDQTTGLAHCYESDKCQPGKNWYGRSLAFHDWISSSLGAPPSSLGDDIDWMFRKATFDLAAEVLRKASRQAALATKQRKPYEERGFPRPGEDSELVSIVTEVLHGHLSSEPTTEEWQVLVQRVRQYITLENKRRNLVGEVFVHGLPCVSIRDHRAALMRV
jgi:hypothetical protein